MNPQDSQIHFCAVLVVVIDSIARVARPWGSTGQARARSPTRGAATPPRDAASVIVLARRRRDGSRVPLRRAQPGEQRFMGGAWVFPGGAVDAHEGEGDAAHSPAALREGRGGGRR